MEIKFKSISAKIFNLRLLLLFVLLLLIHPHIQNKIVIQALTQHSPIDLFDNTDFEEYGFPGTGTKDDPYIISGLNITTSTSTAISVSSLITKYFIIKDCYLRAKDYGIKVSAVSSYMLEINNVTIEQASIGVQITSSSGTVITNSTFIACDTAICLYVCNNMEISNNIIANGTRGISINELDNSLIVNNSIIANSDTGIYLSDSDGNLLYLNILVSNGYEYYQSLGILSQAKDDNGNNTWYNNDTQTGNYWSEWLKNEPYIIPGLSESIDYYPMILPDTDSDGLPNIAETNAPLHTNPNSDDTDGDGLTDGDEFYVYRTDPLNNDTDLDLLLDGAEIAAYGTDPLNPDTDGDGLTDGSEIILYSTNPNSNDTDSDLLSDYEEINTYNTNPLNNDTDSDGLSDGYEVKYSKTNPLNSDTDGDGLNDYDELVLYNTNPNSQDTDLDMLNDYDEVKVYHTSPNNNDTDGDGLGDYVEIFSTHTDPLNFDTDGDGLDDKWEIDNSLNPNSNDTDDDGLTDKDEIYIYHTNPNNADSDGDGLIDGDEVQIYNTSPSNSDTDADGLNDREEVEIYHTNPLNPDTDGDGYTDYQEIHAGTDPNDKNDTPTTSPISTDTTTPTDKSPINWTIIFVGLIAFVSIVKKLPRYNK
ncbi:MAG: NosD domain-containing protein [Candidatus Heimdallarchaeaceae archaeon]